MNHSALIHLTIIETQDENCNPMFEWAVMEVCVVGFNEEFIGNLWCWRWGLLLLERWRRWRRRRLGSESDWPCWKGGMWINKLLGRSHLQFLRKLKHSSQEPTSLPPYSHQSLLSSFLAPTSCCFLGTNKVCALWLWPLLTPHANLAVGSNVDIWHRVLPFMWRSVFTSLVFWRVGQNTTCRNNMRSNRFYDIISTCNSWFQMIFWGKSRQKLFNLSLECKNNPSCSSTPKEQLANQ